ncbi:MAG: M24 family metallopeptidase [Parachlamydiaceae bacterium]|nr:MAG: M24 family metallopeptidase [Parachlamydiaceae bacterium]
MNPKLEQIQQELIRQQVDGWLIYDFRRSNPLACQFLELPENQLLTRRFFYWIPAKGEPVKITHAIENPLNYLPGLTLRFSGWQQMEMHLAKVLAGYKTILMEYSPRNAIPTISKVDAGTIELIRSLGVEVKSSCNLLQLFTTLTEKQEWTHLKAAEILEQIARATWKMISERLQQDKVLREEDVQKFMLDQMSIHGCVTSDPPICAVNENTANPHYSPVKPTSAIIKKGDFILIDLWCKLNQSQAVYADITRVGVASDEPTEKQKTIFNLVRNAQEAATQLVVNRFSENKILYGWEVDQTAREVITAAGYGDYFIHRTGHSIDTSDHGSGVNMDNLETHDQRPVIPGTCFSIEPGVYLPGEFGVRLEYDILISASGKVKITGGSQESIEILF